MSLSLNHLRRNHLCKTRDYFLQTCLPCKVDSVPPGNHFTRAPTSLVRCSAQILSSTPNDSWLTKSAFSCAPAMDNLMGIPVGQTERVKVQDRLFQGVCPQDLQQRPRRAVRRDDGFADRLG
jgi:hypothetical protein